MKCLAAFCDNRQLIVYNNYSYCQDCLKEIVKILREFVWGK